MSVQFDNKRISREYLSNPFSFESREYRLKKYEDIDFTKNSYLKDLGNGYDMVVLDCKDKNLGNKK